MKSNKFYKPASNDTVAIPCFIETTYDSGCYVSFQEFLNSNYGEYEPATIFVPAELHPELVGNGYLSIGAFVGDTYYSIEPVCRVSYVSGGYSLITLTQDCYNRNGTGYPEKITLRCKVSKA